MISSDSEDIEIDYLNMSANIERTHLVSNAEAMGRVVYSSDGEEAGDVNVDTLKDNDDDGSHKTPWFLYILSFFSAIGGFLFGYDTGVVSGAMLLLKDEFGLSSLMQESVVSVTIGFAFLFALFGGILNDRFGRKPTTILASFIFTIGAGILGGAVNVWMLLIGRAILGMGIGLASMTVPMYIAECAPPEKRGTLVTLNNLFITGGQFIASLVDGGFSYDKENGWRYMLGLAAVPSIVQFFGFLFLPESPRWLVANNRLDDARTVLTTIRGHHNVEGELKEVLESVENTKREQAISGSTSTILRILRTPAVRRAVIVGCGLQFFQQLSGINTVMYYSATIIKMSGIRRESDAIWLSAGTASVNFVFTLVGLWLVERLGRRKLILSSLAGVVLSLVVLAIGFQLAAFNSPPIRLDEGNSSCARYTMCEACIEDTDCGFCYLNQNKAVINGSCLPMAVKHPTQSEYGRCNVSTETSDLVWASNYCPTDYSWMGIVGLALYLMFFAPGMGPMPWTINSEIYPLWARSTGSSLSTATNWLCNLLVSMTFLTLIETITKYGTYWLFVGIVSVGFTFMFITVPETKGKKLEDVEKLFSETMCVCRASSKTKDSDR